MDDLSFTRAFGIAGCIFWKVQAEEVLPLKVLLHTKLFITRSI